MIDFCNNDSATTLKNDADIVLQQIDMFFDTDKLDVLDDPSNGTDFERFINELNINNAQIKAYTEAKINAYISLLGFTPTVYVDILPGTMNDIILLTVTLYKDGYTFEKTYKIDNNETI